MRNSIYTLFFATLIGLVSAAILTGVGRFAAPYREANEKAEQVRHVMQVLGIPYEGLSSADLLKKYDQAVKKRTVNGLEFDVYSGGQGGKAVTAVHFAGPGLWGPIEGYIALEPDMKTIHGVTFYKQEETPGLGGEIGAQWFQQQFVGKSIVGPDGKPGVQLVKKGQTLADNQVDAITGATLTSDKVQDMLNKLIEQIVNAKERPANGN
jgi:Na+-transporting NADH:ubiquinone oxidoreductase subunit C